MQDKEPPSEGRPRFEGAATMDAEDEELFRQAFVGMVEVRFGDQNPAALMRDWHFYRKERMSALARAVRQLSDSEASELILKDVTNWCEEHGYGPRLF
jgi:hypothetical protein